MDNKKDLETLCGILSDQISEATRKAKNGMSSSDLETIDKLTHSLASTKKILALSEDDGYSEYDGGAYRDAYRGSYARKRDRMGRYSERGYSRNDLADKMRDLMESAPDDRTRQDMQRLIEKLDA